MPDLNRAHRLRSARVSCGFATARSAAAAFGWNPNTYASNENGNAPFSYARAKVYGAAFGVRPEWLYDGGEATDSDAPRLAGAPARRRGRASAPQAEGREPSPPRAPVPPPGLSPDGLVPVLGRVGADPEGAVLFATGQGTGDRVPRPPGGSQDAVALLIVGHSMRGLADDGGLIYFEHQRLPPTADMLGQVVVVETETDEVLVKRLLRGSRPGLFDLESIRGPIRKDCRLRWAAHITAIIPPHQARRILRLGSA